jgi:hypothetical protein
VSTLDIVKHCGKTMNFSPMMEFIYIKINKIISMAGLNGISMAIAALSFLSSILVIGLLSLFKEKESIETHIVWNVLSSYIFVATLIFVVISISEFIELLNEILNLGSLILISHKLNFTIAVLILLLNIIYARKIYLSNGETDIVSLVYGRFGLTMVYSALVILISLHISESQTLYTIISIVSDIAYTFSIPIVLYLFFMIIKYNRMVQQGVIVIPPELITKSTGIAVSFLLLSSAFIFIFNGLHEVYNILEFGSFVSFIIALETYRNEMWKMVRL